jgi:uncharacterized protein with PIN domain
MPIHYLDASAWVKRYLGEEGSQRMTVWMNRNPLVASAALGVTEVLTTVVRKARAGELSEGERDQILGDVWAEFDAFCSSVSARASSASSAWSSSRWAASLRRRSSAFTYRTPDRRWRTSGYSDVSADPFDPFELPSKENVTESGLERQVRSLSVNGLGTE